MTMITCPRFVPDAVCAAWDALVVPTTTSSEMITDERVDDLPAPTARWLRHALAPDAPSQSGVRFAMRGTIRVGRWLPFTASQVLAPGGFVWAARAGWRFLSISGFDRFTARTGEMAWRLAGLVPVIRADGPDTTRSAVGRHAGESIAFTPAAALASPVTWRAVDDSHATATVAAGGFVHEVTIEVDAGGSLRAVTLPRWGNPDRGPFAEHAFGVILDDDATFDGVTIPSALRAGWWPGTDRWAEGEFFRAVIEHAEFF